ncbi:hypothetical protein [Actinoplanes sp. TFC3]|uniref:hypothetical protein n=1 Tax=Actinoplanes sp. TFC3 TaxID=1710355 RepID=UPI000835047B|nr:hypothetical protein [Actinoplanes sp. TFC3]
MPPMVIHRIIWANNTYYATRRASRQEIEEVLLRAGTSFRRNLSGRAATHQATGRTEAGRPLTVVFIYLRVDQAAIPINAWERR